LEQYFEVNEIANEKQVPALLSLIGGKTSTLNTAFNNTR
jgi:hypothetical protein